MGLSPERWRAVVRGEARGLGPALLRRLLWCARMPYSLGVRWRNRKFDRGRDVHRAGVPVISIGNLTVGGTGKTPCVEYVARLLREQDIRVAILSRGYGAETGRNDEAMVLEENLLDVPHLQDPDRVAIARTAVEELASEVLVLDDGFQHRRLRDLDILLIDTADPWGAGICYRGGLREPTSSLRRAGLIVLTRCDAMSPEAITAGLFPPLAAPDVSIARTVHAPLELTNGPIGNRSTYSGAERSGPSVDSAIRRPSDGHWMIWGPTSSSFANTPTTTGTREPTWSTCNDGPADCRPKPSS